MNVRNQLLATCALAATVVTASAASAQDAPAVSSSAQPTLAPTAAPEPASDDIIVRAQRRSQSSIDVPVQVSSLSGDALAANGVKTLEDIGDRLPNTFFGSNSGYGTPAFSIRGVGGTLSTGGEEPVAIFFDDQFIPRTFPSALLDIESVEVLRGPQATLYGRNATAGAILLRSARPDLVSTTGYVRALVGNFDQENFEGAISTPLSDTFAMRVAGLYNHSDGGVTNTVNGEKLARNEAGRGRISALWKPTSNFELYGNFEYGKSTFGVARAAVADRTATNRTPISEAALDALRDGRYASNSPVGNRKTDARATLTGTLKLSGFDLVASAGYYYTKFGGSTDSDGTALNILYNTGQFRFETFSQDLRAVSSQGGKFDWIVGVSALEDTYEMPYFFIRNVPINRDTHFAGKIPGIALAAYAEGTYKFTDHLSLTVGGRYTYERKRATVMLQGFNLTTGAALAPLSTFREAKNFRAFKPRGILQFKPSDDISLYASVSTGFKSGGYNVFALSSAYNDENIVSYEAGVKGRFLNRKLTASAAAFHYDYKDLQLRLGVPAGGVVIQNAADARINGAEAEMSFRPGYGLDFFGSAAVLDAKIVKYITRDLAGNLVDASGAHMSRAPDFSFSVGGGYSHAIGDKLVARLSGSLSYRSKIYFLETDQDASTFTGRPITTANLRFSLGRVDRGWEVAAFIKNLTDAVEVTQVELQGNFPEATFSERRTFGLELSTHF